VDDHSTPPRMAVSLINTVQENAAQAFTLLQSRKPHTDFR
jgi:hypothetical protein